jgi:hypothetical protein
MAMKAGREVLTKTVTLARRSLSGSVQPPTKLDSLSEAAEDAMYATPPINTRKSLLSCSQSILGDGPQRVNCQSVHRSNQEQGRPALFLIFTTTTASRRTVKWYALHSSTCRARSRLSVRGSQKERKMQSVQGFRERHKKSNLEME